MTRAPSPASSPTAGSPRSPTSPPRWWSSTRSGGTGTSSTSTSWSTSGATSARTAGCSTPGKHAFVPDPYLLTGTVVERENLRRTCYFRAGTGGLLYKEDLFRGKYETGSIRDALANGYLKERAFDPSFEFSRAVQFDEATLVPWPALYEWIPR